MDVDLTRLAQQVKDDLDAYVVPPRDPAAVGEELPEEWFKDGLASMRASLVEPSWIEIRELDPTSGSLMILKVAIVALDPDGCFVAYDPRQEEFVLAVHDADPDVTRGVDAVACGLRGDAVGCFISR